MFRGLMGDLFCAFLMVIYVCAKGEKMKMVQAFFMRDSHLF